MAFAEVGGGTQRATFRYINVDSGTAAFPANVTAGNLLLTCLGNWHALTAVSITVSDTRSTSYTTLLPGGLAWAGGTGKEAIAYGIAPTSGACTMTIDPIAVTGNYLNAVLDEFSGVDSSPLDVDGGETTGTTGAFTEGLTTLTANDLVVGVAMCDGTAGLTAGSGYTLLDTDGTAARQPYAAVFKVASTAGAETVTIDTDTARNWAMSSAAFKETQAGVAGQPLLLRMQHLPHLSTVRPQYGRG